MDRLRPVLRRHSSPASAFLPMVVATNMEAEIQRPLASGVIGGLFPSTVLTLRVLPAAYGRSGERRFRKL